MRTEPRASGFTACAWAAGVALMAVFPATASAHGIGEGAADRTILEFVPFGMEHMLLGWDHLLFIAGVLLLSRDLKMAAKLISVFALGHSITLLTATLAGWELNATAVDVVIALSVVFVAMVGLRGAPEDWRPLGVAIFGFGLVHGLGLATRLLDAGIPQDDIFWRVLAFNIGVEIGQLTALVLMVAVGMFITRHVADSRRFERPAFAALLAAGFIAAAVLSVPTDAEEGGVEDGLDLSSTSCVEGPAPVPTNSLSAGHPPKPFFEPDERAPEEEDLGHILGDSYVVVRYDPDLSAGELVRLREWMMQVTPQIVSAPAIEGNDALTAINAQGSITCSTLDLEGLGRFVQDWFGDQAVPTLPPS